MDGRYGSDCVGSTQICSDLFSLKTEIYIFGSGVFNLYERCMHYAEAESMKSTPHDTTVLCFDMKIRESLIQFTF